MHVDQLQVQMYINYTLKECTGATKYILNETPIGLVYAFPYYPSTTAFRQILTSIRLIIH